MRTPTWLREQIATAGTDLRPGQSQVATVAKLTDAALTRDPTLVRALVEQFIARKLGQWLGDHAAPLDEDDDQPSLFPDLPRRLETSPGRFADLGVMTGLDWDAALRQAETKASNASGFAEAVRRAYDRVRPLLTEATLTTAQVAGQLDEQSAVSA